MQPLLPLIPKGATAINDYVSVWREEDTWTYFVGGMPVFSQPAEDRRQFRFIIAQLCTSGSCRQCEIIRTFGISKNCVVRAVRKLREQGAEGFF